MPRRKKKRPEGAGPQRNEMLSDFWSDRIEAGKKVKRNYTDTGDQVLGYFKAQHEKLYSDPDVRKDFNDFAGSAQISIPKIAQMKNSLGPRLYLPKPDRKIRPKTDDGIMLGLSRLFQAYLNYSVRESKHPRQLRRSIDDGLIRGRAMQRQIWDDVRQIVTSVYVSSEDVVFDPDFDEIESARWIAIRHTEPLWETKRRIPQKWRTDNLDKSVLKDSDDPAEATRSSDQIEYWEVLSKMGAGFRGIEGAEKFPDEEDFVRLEIVPGHKVPLAEGEWEIPLYLDRDWPLSYFDPIETPDSHWPESMAGQVLSCQKGIDLLSTLRISSCKNRDRVVVFCDSKVNKLSQNQLRSGSAADFIPIDIPNGQSLDMIVKVADFGQGSRESAMERAYLEAEIEEATGVTAMVSGGSEEGAKDRSATATQARSNATSARLEDLRQKVEEFETDAARKEAIMVRLWLEQKDVEPYVRVSDLNLFYVKVEVPGGATIPVRSFEQGSLSLKDIYPGCSNYFDRPEKAYEHAKLCWQNMIQSTDPRVRDLANSIKAMGPSPMDPELPALISVAPVTVERVWLDTAGMTAEELMREMHYEIATGAGIKWDRATERENTNMLLQTTLPIMLQNMDYEGANALLQLQFEANDVPEDKRVVLKPPVMPTQPEGNPKDKNK